MTYRISVCNLATENHYPWFANFLAKSGYIDEWPSCSLDKYLKPWNCRDVRNSAYLDFDSEKDAVLFILKWS